MPRDLSFKGMREAIREAAEELSVALDENKDEEDPDRQIVGAVITWCEVIGLAFVQGAQELNEIKHILAEYTAEQE